MKKILLILLIVTLGVGAFVFFVSQTPPEVISRSVTRVVSRVVPTVVPYGEEFLGDVAKFLPYSDEILGVNEKQRHLILFQNNNELRPDGGFISAYGVLEIDDGDVSLDFADVYTLLNDVEQPVAPLPFYVFLNDPGFKGFYFHDANFDPDFETSVQDLEKLYWLQTGKKVERFDSVVAVNFEFLEDIVGIYDLEVSGVTLTAENLFTVLEHEVKNIDTHNVEALANRKNVLGELANKLIKESILSYEKYKELFAVVNKGLDEKKILLYLRNPEMQQLAADEGWTGEFDPASYENYIHTSIANIGGRKSDRYVKKNHEYFVVFDGDKRGRVRYTLSLGHYGGYNLNSDVYKAYVRTFIPKGSVFLSSQGSFYQNRHNYIKDGYFESYLVLNPGKTTQVTIEYLLPKGITQDNFELDVIKQSGTRDVWEMMVQYSSDNSFKAENFDVRDNVGFWTGFLSKDKHFDFEYVQDSLPPLVVWQRFADHNVIEVNFSETINGPIALDPSHYEVVDLNYIDDVTEVIDVTDVYFKNGNMYLVTTGISKVEEERYNLRLINLEDEAGNKTSPSVLEVTVVKRAKEF